MNKEFNIEKVEAKLNLLFEHIEGLIKYNNIIGYDNVKDFIITINHSNNNVYLYNVNIDRGINNPEKSMSFRIRSQKKLNESIKKLFIKLINNPYYKFSSFISDDFYGNIFTINFENKISVRYIINDQNDLLFCRELNELSSVNNIKFRTENKVKDYNKDLIQIEKAKQIISNIQCIFDNLIKLNDIENYENIKPYKLHISSEYDNLKKCDIFKFKILRGIQTTEIVAEYSLSIYEKSHIFKELFNLIYKYMSSEEFIYCGINNYDLKNMYIINLKNLIQIQIETKDINVIAILDTLFKESYDTTKVKPTNINVLKLENK